MDRPIRRYAFFQNRQCEYFPCHKGIAEEDFNCLFCYCPLYMLGKHCGGSFTHTEKGLKSCMNCTYPHHRDNYDAIIARYGEIASAVAWFDHEEEDLTADAFPYREGGSFADG